MRHCVQPATSVDIAFLASTIDENESAGEREPVTDRLLRTCACSAQVWAARDARGTPTALWGVTPMPDDPDVGHLWMLAGETFDDNPAEFALLCRLVFGEMLTRFVRLENDLDVRKTHAVDLLRSIGFTIEPAVRHAGAVGAFHRAWIESDRLSGSACVGRLPN